VLPPSETAYAIACVPSSCSIRKVPSPSATTSPAGLDTGVSQGGPGVGGRYGSGRGAWRARRGRDHSRNEVDVRGNGLIGPRAQRPLAIEQAGIEVAGTEGVRFQDV